MERKKHLDMNLNPTVFSKSSIINNSSSESESSAESASKHEPFKSNINRVRTDKDKIKKHSRAHRSKRSRSNHRRSGSRRRHSRHRHRSRSRSNRKDKKQNESTKLEHKRHRQNRSKSPKREHSERKSYKDQFKERESNNSKDPESRSSKLNSSDNEESYRNRPQKPQYKQRNNEIAIKPELPSVKIPGYLNTTILNPVKYAEVEQKRKLLWSKKDDSKKLNILAWNASSVIASRGDDRKAAKFRKLMGIHDEPNLITQNTQDLFKKEHEQAALFSRLDADYQSARSQTHTSRGVGLGYNQSAYIDPTSYLAGRREEN